MSLILRTEKGSRLTTEEMDDNFRQLYSQSLNPSSSISASYAEMSNTSITSSYLNNGVLEFIGLISQTSNNAPQLITIKDTIGIINTSYEAVGRYSIESNGVFKDNKTIAFLTTSKEKTNGTCYFSDSNKITIYTTDNGSISNDSLNKASLHIMVFP